MKILSFVFLLILSYAADGQSTKPKAWMYLDTSAGRSLMSPCSRPVPENVKGFFRVTDPVRELMEANLNKLSLLKSEGCCRQGEKIKDLSKYICQYLGFVIKGNRFIYINAVSFELLKLLEIPESEWKNNAIGICDGQEEAWGVLFNLDSKEFEQLAFNGPPW